MKFTETPLQGCYIIEPHIFKDIRGCFYESFNLSKFEKETDHRLNFVQDNISESRFGVLRGLHFQLNPYAQAKLVTVLSGEVLDVVVDLRLGSPSFSKSFSIKLSESNKRQLFIPRGFAHGFVTLSKKARFFYKCDNFYAPDYETGISFDDPFLDIDWQIPEDMLIVSKKDQALNPFSEAYHNFEFE